MYILLSFFLFVILPIQAMAKADSWHSLSPKSQATWAALLHFTAGKFAVIAPEFYLVDGKPSLEREYNAARDGLASPVFKCRFPARYYWLMNQLGHAEPDLGECKDLLEYLSRVPAERISLIYSSENVTNPSSMMGHILLKIDGGEGEAQRSHAISFYTELNSINVPKIIYDSMVAGKEGFFMLSPYSEKRRFYLDDEGRNIWEYQLNLDPERIFLLLLHMWELKHTELTYFFDAYNCATVTSNLLGVTHPDLINDSRGWLTPLDVVKHVAQSGLVEATRVETAPRWRVRMLSDTLSKQHLRAVLRFLRDDQFDPPLQSYSEATQYVMVALAKEYVEIESSANRPEEARQLPPQVQSKAEALSNRYSIDLSEYKSPLRTPPDSQVSAGLKYYSEEQFLRLTYLPVAHELDDDNRQYFTENALKLAFGSILINERKIEVENLTLYEATSLAPTDPWLGGLSSHVHLGLRRSYDDNLERRLNFDVSGGLGKSYQPIRQTNFYGLFVGGFGASQGDAFGYFAPEMGIIVNEKRNMKTHVNLRYSFNELNNRYDVWRLRISQMKFFSSHYGVRLRYEWIHNSQRTEHLFQLDMKRYF